MKSFCLLLLCICLSTAWSYSTNQKIQPYQVEDFVEYIAQQIQAAEETVDLAIYDFTSDTIFDAIELACSNGVIFRMYADYDENKGSSSKINELIDDYPEQIEVIFDSRKVHSKFLVIDGQQVLAGSNNWDNDSKDNIEFLLISNDPTIVATVLSAYNKVYPNWESLENSSLSASQDPVFYFKRGMDDQHLEFINSAQKNNWRSDV